MASAIRVVISADVRLFVEGLTEFLAGVDSLDVVGVAESAEVCRNVVRSLRPDVLLIDLQLQDSLEAIKEVISEMPEVNVVALGVPEVEDAVLQCAEAGVAGYVARHASLEDLVSAVHGAMRGELACSPQIARSLMQRVQALSAGRPPLDGQVHLTRREVEIAELLDRGLTNKEIARRLCIEVSTVKNHVHNLLEKLDVRRRGEAAARLRPLLARRKHWQSTGS